MSREEQVIEEKLENLLNAIIIYLYWSSFFVTFCSINIYL